MNDINYPYLTGKLECMSSFIGHNLVAKGLIKPDQEKGVQAYIDAEIKRCKEESREYGK